MGLFKLFAGKTAADYERQADALARDELWGDAKLAYESAIEKSARQSTDDPETNRRLNQKRNQCKEALARSHRREAAALMEAGCMLDARELLTIAMDLTTDAQLKAEMARQMEESARQDKPDIHYNPDVFSDQPAPPLADPFSEDEDDHFNILLGALPEEIQQAYRGYGYHFKHGYLALNQGAFDQAVEHLIQAVEANPEPDSLVPLELATAYVNLNEAAKAEAILEELVQQQPDLLPAFQLLCDIYWSHQAFDKATALLDTLAPELAESMGAYLLKGETLLQADRNEEAQFFFQDLLEVHGWHEPIALGQARAFEALGQIPQARNIYGELIAQCSGCGSRVEPAIKRKYADLSLAAGDHSYKVLEQYLALSREDPANATHYCRNISRIYAAQGHETEARRFEAIARDLEQRQVSEDQDEV